MKPVRATVRVEGLVQGVNFRYYTYRKALENNLTGWVSNLPGGAVEAVFEGRESDVRNVLDWCRQGPAAAQVDEIFIDWENYRGEFSTFKIRR